MRRVKRGPTARIKLKEIRHTSFDDISPCDMSLETDRKETNIIPTKPTVPHYDPRKLGRELDLQLQRPRRPTEGGVQFHGMTRRGWLTETRLNAQS